MRPLFLSTYTLVLLEDWTLLKNAVLHYSQSETATEASPLGRLINPEQLQEVLRGPYSPLFTEFLHYRTLFARVQLELSFREEALNQGEYQAQRPKLADGLMTGFPESLLVSARKEFDTLFQSTRKAWDEFYQTTAGTLRTELNALGIVLTDLEQEGLLRYETISNLIHQCSDQNLTLPKSLDMETSFSFEHYWMLRSLVIIEGALSRQHLPHGPEDLEKHMKNLRKFYKSVLDQTEVLEKTLVDALKKLTAPFEAVRSSIQETK